MLVNAHLTLNMFEGFSGSQVPVFAAIPTPERSSRFVWRQELAPATWCVANPNLWRTEGISQGLSRTYPCGMGAL